MSTPPLSQTPDGKATTIRKTFSRETSVRVRIQADASIIWKLLTLAADYPRWNPTVVSIEGVIESGAQIALKSTLDPKRTFKLKVKAFDPEKQLVWGDAMGSRVYTLTPQPDQSVLFSMTEKIGGLMFPLFANLIPPFDESFEQFAASLKKEAEAIQNTQN